LARLVGDHVGPQLGPRQPCGGEGWVGACARTSHGGKWVVWQGGGAHMPATPQASPQTTRMWGPGFQFVEGLRNPVCVPKRNRVLGAQPPPAHREPGMLVRFLVGVVPKLQHMPLHHMHPPPPQGHTHIGRPSPGWAMCSCNKSIQGGVHTANPHLWLGGMASGGRGAPLSPISSLILLY
jgi:hypothetical protein